MSKTTINVGLVGYKFMGKAHSFGFRNSASIFPNLEAIPVMKAICGRQLSQVKQAAEELGWESYETDWRQLISRDDIDLVDITTSNDSHAEIAIAAAQAGKHIFCEKPMAMNVAEARLMLAAAEKAGVKHMVNFNYRTVPAVALAKKMIDDGILGRIYHWRSVYLQDWLLDASFPLLWRLQKEIAGSGALGDLAAHSVDLALWLVGDIDEVSSNLTTFIEARPKTDGSGLGPVTVDDAVIALAKFKNGAIGTIEVSRFAAGNKNGNRFEVNGEKGSIRFDLERLNELHYFNNEDPEGLQGWRTINVTESIHPYISGWWPSGHIIGWGETFINQVANLMDAITKDKMPSPNFLDGLKCQLVLDAMERSSESRKWERLEKV